MKKVLLPERLIVPATSLLEKYAEVVLLDDFSEENILSNINGVFGIVLRTRAQITRRIIEAADSLRVISRTGAGYDNVDVDAATEHGVMVCNLPGINSTSVAEHTLALLFALVKQLKLMDGYTRTGNWQRRSDCIARDVSGMMLGIVGLGKIGREVMVRAKAMGMDILAYDPYVNDDLEGITVCKTLEELFANSDVITVHVPSLSSTKGLVSRKLISLMKPTAYLINTSRGAVVDEEALVEALRTGAIAGAGLDVFVEEPIAEDNPLIQLDNVILTPHSAALTRECGYKMTMEAVRQIIDCLEGRVPQNVVNREVLESN